MIELVLSNETKDLFQKSRRPDLMIETNLRQTTSAKKFHEDLTNPLTDLAPQKRES